LRFEPPEVVSNRYSNSPSGAYLRFIRTDRGGRQPEVVVPLFQVPPRLGATKLLVGAWRARVFESRPLRAATYAGASFSRWRAERTSSRFRLGRTPVG
jgi:hypothetical protein